MMIVVRGHCRQSLQDKHFRGFDKARQVQGNVPRNKLAVGDYQSSHQDRNKASLGQTRFSMRNHLESNSDRMARSQCSLGVRACGRVSNTITLFRVSGFWARSLLVSLSTRICHFCHDTTLLLLSLHHRVDAPLKQTSARTVDERPERHCRHGQASPVQHSPSF